MRPPARRPHRAIAVLMVAAVGLFVIGVASESDQDTHNETVTETAETAETDQHNEQIAPGESAGREAAESRREQAEGNGENEPGEERVLGIDVESPLLITTAVVVSLLLAGLVWRRPLRRLLLAVAGFAALFAAFDLVEVTHQLDEDNSRLAILAAVIAALHAATAAIALHRAAATPVHDPAPV
jgi:hypothetical protein